MSDAVEDFRALKEYRKQQRRLLGINCLGCLKVNPRRSPTLLMPGQKCRVCGYRDMRDAEVPA